MWFGCLLLVWSTKNKRNIAVKIRALALSSPAQLCYNFLWLVCFMYRCIQCAIQIVTLQRNAVLPYLAKLVVKFVLRALLLSNTTKCLSVSTIQRAQLVYNNFNMSIMFSMSIFGLLRALYTSTQCGLAEFNLVTGVLQIWSSPDKSVPHPSLSIYIHRLHRAQPHKL